MGNLAFAAAERGCDVLALDASPAAIRHIQQRAAAEALPVHEAVADLRDYELDEDFDAVEAPGATKKAFATLIARKSGALQN